MTTPINANAGCVGPTSQNAGRSAACAGCPNQSACASGAASATSAAAAGSSSNDWSSLSAVSHVVLVLSGKGGVGKSTVAAQMAHCLSIRGYDVALLDADLCGPSVARMTAAGGRQVHQSSGGWEPVYVRDNLAIMSISFLLEEKDAAVVWRGPRKNGLLKQFLTTTNWGDAVDYLIVDTPPGTSDEHISTVQFLNEAKAAFGVSFGAVVVTTPEEMSMADVRRELNFCKKTKTHVLGIVENMAAASIPLHHLTFADDTQQDRTNDILNLIKQHSPHLLPLTAQLDVFRSSGAGPQGMARAFQVPYLGKLPLDPNILQSCEQGSSFVHDFPDSPAAKQFNSVVDQLIKAMPVEED